MKFTQRLSLRVRLTLIFLILASVTWLLSSFVAWKQTTDNVDELFDTQLMLFAKRLSTLDLNEINAADRMAQTPDKYGITNPTPPPIIRMECAVGLEKIQGEISG